MRARADTDRDDGVMGIGVALLGEGLDVPVAVLVAVIHDPGFLGSPLGDTHWRLRTDMAISCL